jgi:LysM repeat protein
MKPPAETRVVNRRGAVVGGLALFSLAVLLVAACSTGNSARRAGTSTSTVATTSTTAKPTTTTNPVITYQVKRGDSLTAIAARFRVAVSAIVTRNHITNPDSVAMGRVLVIPPAPPLSLQVTPTRGQNGQTFHLELRGAVPSETIHFEIDSPAGPFKGGPHVVTAAGTVSATYQPAEGDPPGTYTVVATGDKGTTAQASFHLTGAPSST